MSIRVPEWASIMPTLVPMILASSKNGGKNTVVDKFGIEISRARYEEHERGAQAPLSASPTLPPTRVPLWGAG